MAVSISYDRTPSTPLGLTARFAPAWGGDAMSGAEALWGRDTMGGMGMGGGSMLAGAGNRLDTEVGYGLPVGSRFVGTPRTGLTCTTNGGSTGERRSRIDPLPAARVVVAEQEPGGGQEVLVMLLVLDLRVGGVELVGHRGEQQRAHSLAVVRLGPEEFLGPIGRGIALRPLRTEQVLEALKLVDEDREGNSAVEPPADLLPTSCRPARVQLQHRVKGRMAAGAR